MNALIYKSLQQFVLDMHDFDTWDLIVGKAHASSTAENSFQRVNGSGMSHLVNVAAAVTERDINEMLEAAGRNWVTRNATQVAERLTRLNRASFGDGTERDVTQFHNGIGMIFPALRPPVLNFLAETPHKGRLQYTWHRDAFAPFVLGLLTGIAECFDKRLTVTALPMPPKPKGETRDTSLFAATIVVATSAAADEHSATAA
ncbi:MAG: heme NO-binding domain-containing protein [Acidobacteria bacterium]|nr:heme NO-binding domain-containing protein [Acidobacteriota bacterium]